MTSSDWPGEWVRAALPGAVLALVGDEDAYGYLIAQRLAAAGFGTIKGSTLYPLLARLEQDGVLTSTWQDGSGGPGRKYYSITEAGRHQLREHRRSWGDFTTTTTAVLAEKRDAR
ncbi:PadR family transcriptional regulator [Pseudoclavibacter sp. RFBA6]|uniref:PadR family transcriptional regulator n=1 Tax=Pseudoclavibacter sp. RFBA6 TaxID=2080573 RepID=UPI000CE8DFC9|nr:PadR family transcriptional regulator [Pseudoclavibacter sp. RFBA6]PPG37415.1 PadR family transcriptional regulator [Pseudoclavibacter sp. RFBA6]